MAGDATSADWIAVDWGTSNLRVWAMSASGTQLGFASSGDGMATLSKDGFEPALLSLISPWIGSRKIPIIACGMVGSRQGWVEAPYAATPCAPLPGGLVRAPTRDAALEVRVISGVKQMTPADVMRGEETQIAGFLALNPGWDGVICLPGTHTKWVHISANEIISFQTFMTGELFSTISNQTVLRHSIAKVGWDTESFESALDTAMSRPERLAASLFSLRAASLLQDVSGAAARARLSGLLIGAELAAAKPYWLGQQVALIGDKDLSEIYAKALSLQGVPCTRTDAERMTLAGLSAAYSISKE